MRRAQGDADVAKEDNQMTESFEALRVANPRTKPAFPPAVEAVAHSIRTLLAEEGAGAAKRQALRPGRPGRVVGVSAAGVALAAAAAAAVFLTIGSNGVTPSVGVEDAAAAVKQAATVTAAAAEESGTAVVQMTLNGDPWAGETMEWNGADLSVVNNLRDRDGKVGAEWRVVDGMMYTLTPDGWAEMGHPSSIDPDSGTTPAETLAAVREDVGGTTLTRIVDGMVGLTAEEHADGSTIYRGTVAAGLVARETGFKDGEKLRVLPFGYVANDAADPATPLDTAVTVGADGVIREIAVTWGAGDSAWTYTVAYSKLGETPAPVAPENPRPLREMMPGETAGRG
jgi:hypothetical protein